MDALDDFRAGLHSTESLLYLIVPSSAVHFISAEVLPSIIYRRPGIRPIQWLSSELISQNPANVPETPEKLNFPALHRLFTRLLLDAHPNPKSEAIEDNHPEKSLKPCDFRAILLQPGITRENILEIFDKRFSTRFPTLHGDLWIHRTELHYSFQHVSFADSLRQLYENFALTEKPAGENDPGSACVHAFEQIGHIAHVNLPHTPADFDSVRHSDRFKFIFGALILDHHPQIAIVLNKTRRIDSKFREMALEVLAARPPVGKTPESSSFRFSAHIPENARILPQASHTQPSHQHFVIAPRKPTDSPLVSASGEIYVNDHFLPDSPIYSVSKIKHNGCRFSFSFRSCFFNRRLEEEHRRMKTMLAGQSSAADVVFDVFAGVGPISIPIAVARRARLGGQAVTGVVHANDLNPECHRFMCANIRLNGLKAPATGPPARLLDGSLYVQGAQARVVCPWNLDGVDFVQQALQLWARREKTVGSFAHFIMNLPGSAVEDFLFPFAAYTSGACDGDTRKEAAGDGIIVHAYTFIEKSDGDAVRKVYDGLRMSATLPAVTLEAFRANYLPSPPETVRFVSPSRKMVRISFALSPETATAFRACRMG